jgi:hypothetical protein
MACCDPLALRVLYLIFVRLLGRVWSCDLVGPRPGGSGALE